MAMKSKGLVRDQPEFFAPSVVPRIVAHGFTITDSGRKEVELLQSTANPVDPIPLGWRIPLYLSHGNPLTIGSIAKMSGAPNGQVRRVMKSLQNNGLVDCLVSRTRTTFGWDAITHLWGITELGRQVLDVGPETYLRIVRKPKRKPRASKAVADS